MSRKLKQLKNKISFLGQFFSLRGFKSTRPKTSKILKILEPKTLDIARLDKFLNAEKAETAHSGAEVPMPSNITPIKKGFKWKLLDKKWAFLTKISAPKARKARPKASKTKIKKPPYISSRGFFT